jgi:hypothetical protein
MDMEILKERLTERFRQSLDSALEAVNQAPDGHWIDASEWEVREIFQKLTADCFQAAIQERLNGLPSASQAAFSPDGPGGVPSAQGQSKRVGIDGRR